MDVLLRLRVLIWLLVISLWGVMVYQYLGEEEKDVAKMKRIAPYGVAHPPSTAPSADDLAMAGARPTETTVYAPAAIAPPVAPLPPIVPPGNIAVNPETPITPPPDTTVNVIPSTEYVGPAPSTSRRKAQASAVA